MRFSNFNQNPSREILGTLKEIGEKRCYSLAKTQFVKEFNQATQKELEGKSEEELAEFCINWLSDFSCNQEIRTLFLLYRPGFIVLNDEFVLSNLSKIGVPRNDGVYDWDEISIEVWNTSQRKELVDNLCKEIRRRRVSEDSNGELFRLASDLLGIRGNVWDNVNNFLREKFLK